MPSTKVGKRFTPSTPQPAKSDSETPIPTARKKSPEKQKLDVAKKSSAVIANENHVVDGKPVIRGKHKLTTLSELRPNRWNYNEQSDFIFEKLKKSLQEFGFTEPITVRSSNEEGPLGFYEIVGGEHRWKAATELGMKEVPIIDVGMMPDASLKKFMIVLNETKGRANNDQLALVLSELHKDGVDLTAIPYDEAEIQSLVSMGDFDWSAADASAVDTGDDAGEGDGDEEGDGDVYVGMEDVLDLEACPQEVDEMLAKRLERAVTATGVSPSRPWEVISKLLDVYYAHTKKTEVVESDDE